MSSLGTMLEYKCIAIEVPELIAFISKMCYPYYASKCSTLISPPSSDILR